MLTVPEAAKRVAKNPETVRRWIREGKLTSRKIGTRHFIEEKDLDSLLQGDVLPAPPGWEKMWNSDPMPNWVALIREGRSSR